MKHRFFLCVLVAALVAGCTTPVGPPAASSSAPTSTTPTIATSLVTSATPTTTGSDSPGIALFVSYEVVHGRASDLFNETGLLIALQIKNGYHRGENATYNGSVTAPTTVQVEPLANGSSIRGPLPENDYDYGLRAFASAAGSYEFVVQVENLAARSGYGGRDGTVRYVTVTGDEESATVTVTRGPWHYFNVSYGPGGGAPNEALLIVQAPIAAYAEVLQSWPETEGPSAWNGTLVAGTNEIRFYLKWPASWLGYGQPQPASAAVYPDVLASLGSDADGLQVRYVNGTTVVEEASDD